MQKTCRLCGLVAPAERFTRSRSYKDGRATLCRPCNNKQSKKSRVKRRAKEPEVVRQWERAWYQTHKYLAARARAKRREIPFLLTEDVYDALQATNCCGFCGCGFDGSRRWTTLTIDRVDTLGPYADWNCAAICHGCNAKKNNMTADTLRKLADWIDETQAALAHLKPQQEPV